MLAAKAAVDCIAGASQDKTQLWSVNADDDYHEDASSSEQSNKALSRAA